MKYHILEFDKIINSSDADIQHAQKIGQTIYSKYKDYDAFIVLVGLDTACYIASLVSFMYANLGKTVISLQIRFCLQELSSLSIT